MRESASSLALMLPEDVNQAAERALVDYKMLRAQRLCEHLTSIVERPPSFLEELRLSWFGTPIIRPTYTQALADHDRELEKDFLKQRLDASFVEHAYGRAVHRLNQLISMSRVSNGHMMISSDDFDLLREYL